MSSLALPLMDKKVSKELLLLQATVYNFSKIPVKRSIFCEKNSNAVSKYSMHFNESIRTTPGSFCLE